MKKLVWFSNLIFYCMYQLEIASFKKNTPKEIEESLFKNPRTGSSLLGTSSHFGAFLLSAESILLYFIQVLLQKNLIDFIFANPPIYKILVSMFIMIIPSIIFEHYIIYKNKRYLKFFQQFDQMPRNKIRLYMILCLIVYISLIILAIGSFTWFTNYAIFPK